MTVFGAATLRTFFFAIFAGAKELRNVIANGILALTQPGSHKRSRKKRLL